MNNLTQEYIDYIQSPEWDTKRMQRLIFDGFTCQDCGAKNKSLDVDHLTYERFGFELISDLQTLCRGCHDYKHGKTKRVVIDYCKTCGELLPIFLHRVRIFGVWVTYHTCQNGCIRSYSDVRPPYTS